VTHHQFPTKPNHSPIYKKRDIPLKLLIKYLSHNLYGIEVVRYEIAYGAYPCLQDIEVLLKSSSNITHLAVVHHETTTGMLNPVEEISMLAHEYGVEVIVDAMSSYAGVPIDINKWNIDYLVSSSNKCVQGMAGITFVVCRKDLLKALRENRRSYYLDLYSQFDYFEKTRQMQFTPPVQIAYALRQALDELFEEGLQERCDRYRENWEVLYKGLSGLGFKFLLPKDQESGILVAVCEPKDDKYRFDNMHDYLFERGFTIYPGKGANEATFRLAVLGALTREDIDAFLIQLRAYIEDSAIENF